jgi:hypothetical protein
MSLLDNILAGIQAGGTGIGDDEDQQRRRALMAPAMRPGLQTSANTALPAPLARLVAQPRGILMAPNTVASQVARPVTTMAPAVRAAAAPVAQARDLTGMAPMPARTAEARLASDLAAGPSAPQFQPPKQGRLRRILTGAAIGAAGRFPEMQRDLENRLEPPSAEQNYEQQIAQDTAAANLERQQQQDQLNRENVQSEIASRGKSKPVVTAQKPIERNVMIDGKPAIQQFRNGQWTTEAGVEPYSPSPEKPAAVGTPHPGTLDGKPAWGVLTPTGWQDPNTHQPIPNFEPQPAYAETGLWDPIMVPNPNGKGGMVPAKFNRRTGETVIAAPRATTAIPQAAQKQIDEAEKDAMGADQRYQVMLESEPQALAGNQQAMMLIVSNHIGMTLGQQKGSRINQAVWNEAVESSPWLARAEAKFDKRGYLSGVVLTPAQIHQMVDLAKLQRGVNWNKVKETATQYGVPNAVSIPPGIEGNAAQGTNAGAAGNAGSDPLGIR